MATIKLALIAVVALVAIEHDGVKYGPGQDAGEAFELTEAQAKPLLEVGAIKLVQADADTGADGNPAPAAPTGKTGKKT
jgi:hypothetical protein